MRAAGMGQEGPGEALQGAVWTWADRCPHRIPCDVCDNLFVSSFLKKENESRLTRQGPAFRAVARHDRDVASVCVSLEVLFLAR